MRRSIPRHLWYVLRRLAGAPVEWGGREPRATPHTVPHEPPFEGSHGRGRADALAASGLIETPGASATTVEELTALENRGIPSIGRTTDAHEAVADERQDATTSLNFPLHSTSAVQSWPYLFDFGVACDLLAPRPDDLVLALAPG